MADEKPDALTEQIDRQIAFETIRAVANLADRMAEGIAKKNKNPKISKHDIFVRVAAEFNKTTMMQGAEVVVQAAPGVGRGPLMGVKTKQDDE